jgi:hypothetical protein
MRYERISTPEFFENFCTEEAARDLLWRSKYEGKDFVCPRCTHENFYQHNSRPEVRQCRLCDRQVRLRAGTLLENTKISVLIWVRALFLITQDKRGVSALQLKRQLGMRSYDTAWRLLHRIREAMRQRDERYKLHGTVELDGANFGEQKDKTRKKVLVAIETKQWVDEQGRTKSRAGFAKVTQARESKIYAQQFIEASTGPATMVNTDAGPALTGLVGIDADNRVMAHAPEKLDGWLPWVQKWTENARAWLTGTFHGVRAKYFVRYLAEYNYRFNRRHDPMGLFHRVVTACMLATPTRADALFG